MNMRISNIMKAYDVHSTNKVNNTQRMTRAEEKKDMVAISTQAKDYQAIAKALKDVPDVRNDIVNDIQSRIEAGTYDVTTSDLCDKLISKIKE